MRTELQNGLLRDFPELYRDYTLPMTQTCMCWGFETPDEWEPVIRKLSEKLKTLIEKTPEKYEAYRAAQVKEKWGGLRFYMTAETEGMSEAIDEAECEVQELEVGKNA